MPRPPFVRKEHLEKLKLEKSLIETSEERMMYPFQRSTSDAVFSGFSETQLRSALFYLMFDLFPGAKFDSDITPSYLVNYAYDRARFLYVELRKLDASADALFLVFAVLLSEYQKTLYASETFEKIQELYKATNNWLLLKDNVLLNTSAMSSVNTTKICQFEAENDEGELRSLAVSYFRDGEVLEAVRAAEALGRVRLALAMTDFTLSSPNINRVQEILGFYREHASTDKITMTRWAANELYISDDAFSFLRDRQYIANETWKGTPGIEKIMLGPEYPPSVSWGHSRPVFAVNECYMLPEVCKPAVWDEKSEEEKGESTQRESKLHHLSISIDCDAVQATQEPKEAVSVIHVPLKEEESFHEVSEQQFTAPEIPIIEPKPWQAVDNEASDMAERLAFAAPFEGFAFSQEQAISPFGTHFHGQSEVSESSAAQSAGSASKGLTTSHWEHFDAQEQTREPSHEPVYEVVTEVSAPSQENAFEVEATPANKREIREIMRTLKQEYVADVLLEYVEELKHQERLDEIVRSIKSAEVSIDAEETVSPVVAEPEPLNVSHVIDRSDYMNIIDRFWPSMSCM